MTSRGTFSTLSVRGLLVALSLLLVLSPFRVLGADPLDTSQNIGAIRGSFLLCPGTLRLNAILRLSAHYDTNDALLLANSSAELGAEAPCEIAVILGTVDRNQPLAQVLVFGSNMMSDTTMYCAHIGARLNPTTGDFEEANFIAYVALGTFVERTTPPAPPPALVHDRSF